MTATRKQRIESLLSDAFEPAELLVKDQSHLHAGHAGARDGKGHFDVKIVSKAFSGLSPIERHKAVFAALNGLMDTEIHALKIHAKAPDDA